MLKRQIRPRYRHQENSTKHNAVKRRTCRHLANSKQCCVTFLAQFGLHPVTQCPATTFAFDQLNAFWSFEILHILYSIIPCFNVFIEA